jgi:hypothetical protein
MKVLTRVGGILLAVVGAALTVYSFPFVTFVALAAFLIGIGTCFLGLRLAVTGRIGSN